MALFGFLFLLLGIWPRRGAHAEGQGRSLSEDRKSRVLLERDWNVSELVPHDHHLYWTEDAPQVEFDTRRGVGLLDLDTGAIRAQVFKTGLHGLTIIGQRLLALTDGCDLSDLSIDRGTVTHTRWWYRGPCLSPFANGSTLYYADRQGHPTLFKVNLQERKQETKNIPQLQNGISYFLIDGNVIYVASQGDTARPGQIVRVRNWKSIPEPFFSWPARAPFSQYLIMGQNRDTIFVGSAHGPELYAIPKNEPSKFGKIGATHSLFDLAATDSEVFWRGTDYSEDRSRRGEVVAIDLASHKTEVVESKDAIGHIAVSDGKLFWIRSITDAKGLVTGSQIMVSDRRNPGRAAPIDRPHAR